MKTDLSETSIIIHYRKDSDDRAFNLKTIFRFLEENVDFKELIIVNDNSCIDEEMSLFKNQIPRIRGLFFENHDHFKKTYAFNKGAAYSTGKVLCFYDVDVLIEPKFLKEAQDKILSGEYDHIYPFTGTFMNVKKELFPQLLENFDFEFIKNEKENVELASTISPGGCNLISKEAFERIGGYDTAFIGWGFEDTDFHERSKRANKVTYLHNPDAICWHLEHSNSIRLENPHYQNNLRKFVINNRISN